MLMKDAGGGDARSGSTATAENEGGNEAVGIEKEKEAEGGQGEITYRTYAKEEDLYALMSLVDQELSEPYSIFTYRYFVYNWPQLCFLAIEEIEGKEHCVGALVCKADLHKQILRGYVAMLVVERRLRKRGIGKHLVKLAIDRMISEGCLEVVLEAEVTNKAALNLYSKLGFIRDKRLYKYYLTGTDAFRLKLAVAPTA